MSGPIIPRDTFDHGSKSSIGTDPVPLVNKSIRVKRGVVVKASTKNDGIVYVGTNPALTPGTNDETDGWELSARDTITVEINDVRSVLLIEDTPGQRVFWVGV